MTQSPLRRLLAAYREAVKLHDPNTDDAISGKAHNAVLHAELLQQAVNCAANEMSQLGGHITTRTADMLRKLELRPKADSCAVPAAEYMRGPRGVCVQVVGIDTGEE